jgi:predicted amidohydrolase YtcJ
MSAREAITLYRARRVLTLDPAFPTAEAVAVRDGRILGVGTAESLAAWGPAQVDDRFADDVLLPGFVEAHSHVLSGGVWAHEYVGYFERRGADGRMRPGCTNLEQLLERLRALDRALMDPDEQLIVWGFDPIYFEGERLAAKHLDRVSRTRPIFLFHASGHLATVNTALMEREGFAEGAEVEGLPRGTDGRPLGELQEPAAMSLARTAFIRFMRGMQSRESIVRMGEEARFAGLTTMTELGTAALGNDDVVETWARVVDSDDFPVRVSAFYNPGFDAARGRVEERVERVLALRKRSSEKFRLGHVKMILDGSIQGFTARLNYPGYLGGQPNGIWLMAPEAFRDNLEALHRAGVTVHVHCNGDEAVDLFLETLEPILRAHPWPDHRHTVQHCQLTTAAQYRRMATLGMNANIFSNHLWYWGDQHYEITLGADRAARMNASATALREGVRFSLHTDASITPLGSLHTAWCAVNRITPKGRVLGPDECISVWQALRAVTVDAAHQLHMDHEIGTLEAGKRADMVALARDPFSVEPTALRDIEVRGTVLGGVPFDSGC